MAKSQPRNCETMKSVTRIQATGRKSVCNLSWKALKDDLGILGLHLIWRNSGGKAGRRGYCPWLKSGRWLKEEGEHGGWWAMTVQRNWNRCSLLEGVLMTASLPRGIGRIIEIMSMKTAATKIIVKNQ